MRLSNLRFAGNIAVAALAFASVFAASQALAAPKAVYRVDSVHVSSEGNRLSVEARGAVRSGGWSDPRLVVRNSQGHTLILEMRASPPGPGDVVIQALLPVTATITLRPPASATAVQVVSETNSVSQPIPR